MNTPYDYLVVGAGLFGSVFAHEARKAGRRCLVVDRRTHTGGNIYCRDEDGIQVHAYGAHIFHTGNGEVWRYVNGLTAFNRFTNSPVARYGDRLYSLPFNMNTFYQLWGTRTPAEARAKIEEQRAAYAHIEHPRNLEEQALKLCGDDIYRLLIKGYTEKQWGRPATELPAFIIRRIPLRFTFDNNYFDDPFQGIPTGGYNRLTDALLQGVETRLGTDYLAHRAELDTLARRIVYTGCIDEFFDYRLGRLEYRSLRFEHQRLDDTDNYQGNAVVNYCERSVPYTRIIEHKHFDAALDCLRAATLHGRYPRVPRCLRAGQGTLLPRERRAQQPPLRTLPPVADMRPDVLFGGRLGRYAYADMDDTVAAALALWRQEAERAV